VPAYRALLSSEADPAGRAGPELSEAGTR
jgi:hypothetical protein